MLHRFKIILIKEEDCLCQFIYKGKYYTAVHKRYRWSPITDNGSYALLEGKREKVSEKDLSEFKDGKYERFYIDCEIWPRQEYMTCMELYTSLDFEEAVKTALMYRGNPTHLMTHIQDVDGNKLVSGGYYRSIPNVHAVFYRDGKYHYVTTDSFCDVTEHTSFSDEAKFWEYVESTPYIRNLMECPNAKYIGYISKCVNGRYVPEKMTAAEKLSELTVSRNPEYIASAFPRSEPVMRVYEHPEKNDPPRQSYEYKNGSVWVGTTSSDEHALSYEFNCFVCSEKLSLRTGRGRYGALGPFKCPFCGEKYNSSIEDNAPCPHVYVVGKNGGKAVLDCLCKKEHE